MFLYCFRDDLCLVSCEETKLVWNETQFCLISHLWFRQPVLACPWIPSIITWIRRTSSWPSDLDCDIFKRISSWVPGPELSVWNLKLSVTLRLLWCGLIGSRTLLYQSAVSFISSIIFVKWYWCVHVTLCTVYIYEYVYIRRPKASGLLCIQKWAQPTGVLLFINILRAHRVVKNTGKSPLLGWLSRVVKVIVPERSRGIQAEADIMLWPLSSSVCASINYLCNWAWNLFVSTIWAGV